MPEAMADSVACVLLRAVEPFDSLDDAGKGRCVVLWTLQLWNTAEAARSDAAARGICEVGVVDSVLVGDLGKYAVVGDLVLDGLSCGVL